MKIKDSKDLKYIKRHYGEDFAELCGELFGEILSKEEGLLKKIIFENFAPNRFLYNDIMKNNAKMRFKDFINKIGNFDKIFPYVSDDPFKLMDKAGYNLYKCENIKDIMKFKKYFAPGEEICTVGDAKFLLDRTNDNLVFFAVKKNVEKIKRENFPNPKRQDEYGTSVISIQFYKEGVNNLKVITNRYNHHVDCADETFNLNLENIIPGLTQSFRKKYKLKSAIELNEFSLPNYVEADGKLWRYNIPDQKFFCINNVTIERSGKVESFDKSSYILIDQFLLNRNTKKIENKNAYASGRPVTDSFPDYFNNIKNCELKIIKNGKNREIIFQEDGKKDVIITINERNAIIGYDNENITNIDNNFLSRNRELEFINLPNVEKIGNYFLTDNIEAKKINIKNVKYIGKCALEYNNQKITLKVPKVEEIGDFFLFNNSKINKLEAPKLKIIGREFMFYSKNRQEIINNFLSNINQKN